MPNWCHNHLIIKTTKLKEVINKITNKEGITFEKFLPTPPILLKQISPTPKNVNEKELNRLKEKYGATDWYMWRCNNWGCKWDAVNTHFNDTFDVEFDTPWGPPIEFFINLSKKFPETEFSIQFSDEFMGQYPLGEVKIINDSIEFKNTPKERSTAAQKISNQIWEGIWADLSKYNKEN